MPKSVLYTAENIFCTGTLRHSGSSHFKTKHRSKLVHNCPGLPPIPRGTQGSQFQGTSGFPVPGIPVLLGNEQAPGARTRGQLPVEGGLVRPGATRVRAQLAKVLRHISETEKELMNQ